MSLSDGVVIVCVRFEGALEDISFRWSINETIHTKRKHISFILVKKNRSIIMIVTVCDLNNNVRSSLNTVDTMGSTIHGNSTQDNEGGSIHSNNTHYTEGKTPTKPKTLWKEQYTTNTPTGHCSRDKAQPQRLAHYDWDNTWQQRPLYCGSEDTHLRRRGKNTTQD